MEDLERVADDVGSGGVVGSLKAKDCGQPAGCPERCRPR